MHTIILALHIIGAGLMLGVVFFALVIYFKKSLEPSVLAILRTILLFGTIGAIWQVITGLYLFFNERSEFQDSQIFWIKIGLFILDGILALFIIDRKIKTAEARAKGEIILKDVRSWGLLSLMIILSIIILGVYLTEG